MVEHDPRDSPLWGWYQRALDQLAGAVVERSAAAADLIAELQYAGDVELYRAAKYQAAVTDEERPRWVRLVPVGCVEGVHDWREWGGRVECGDCGTVAP